jgi:two-component system, chemotaxis family, chemotaxis protein CheY
MRALVVDDSSAMRALLRIALKKRGFEVAEAKHGVEALSMLAGAPGFDLILIDWNMPEMDGLELLCRIRKEPAHDRTQIMMVTTETGMEQMSEALEAGANDYMMKPFTFDVVAEKLQLLGL